MAYNYMANFVLNFDTTELDSTGIFDNGITLAVPVFDRTRVQKLKSLINTVPSSWISTKIVSNNEPLEKISYDLYDSTEYWDVLLLLNERSPLFDMAYDYDVIAEAGETATQTYESEVLNKSIDDNNLGNDGLTTRERFRLAFQEERAKNNDAFQTLIYIKKDKIWDFVNLMYNDEIV